MICAITLRRKYSTAVWVISKTRVNEFSSNVLWMLVLLDAYSVRLQCTLRFSSILRTELVSFCNASIFIHLNGFASGLPIASIYCSWHLTPLTVSDFISDHRRGFKIVELKRFSRRKNCEVCSFYAI